MRNQNPRLAYMNRVKNITPQLRYDEKESFEQWQIKSREKLIELLGLDLFEKCDLDFLQEEVKEFDEYTQIRFSFQSEPGYYVPAYIQIPKNLKGKIKPMICLQGHSTGMHISLGMEKFPGDDKRVSKKREAQYAREYGYCPVVMEQRYMGECGGLPTGSGCHTPWGAEHQLSVLSTLALGRTAIGERVWDISRMIDVLEKHFDMLDIDNICCMGSSGGGTATFYAACIEERIKACIPSVAVCTFKDSIIGLKHCPCNYIQGIARYFDMGDLAGLIAPRKLVMFNGQLDHGFLIQGASECADIAKKLYTHAGCPQNMEFVVGELGHYFVGDKAYRALNKMI